MVFVVSCGVSLLLFSVLVRAVMTFPRMKNTRDYFIFKLCIVWKKLTLAVQAISVADKESHGFVKPIVFFFQTAVSFGLLDYVQKELKLKLADVLKRMFNVCTFH